MQAVAQAVNAAPELPTPADVLSSYLESFARAWAVLPRLRFHGAPHSPAVETAVLTSSAAWSVQDGLMVLGGMLAMPGARRVFEAIILAGPGSTASPAADFLFAWIAAAAAISTGALLGRVLGGILRECANRLRLLWTTGSPAFR